MRRWRNGLARKALAATAGAVVGTMSFGAAAGYGQAAFEDAQRISVRDATKKLMQPIGVKPGDIVFPSVFDDADCGDTSIWFSGSPRATCNVYSYVSVVVDQTVGPLAGSQTGTLRGSTACPLKDGTNYPWPIAGVQVFKNRLGFMSGIRALCLAQHPSDPNAPYYSQALTWIGSTDETYGQQATICFPFGSLGFGFGGRSGWFIDAMALQCAQSGSSWSGMSVGGTGGDERTPVKCPKGYVLSGLQAEYTATYHDTTSITRLSGKCTDYPPNRTLGAVAGGGLVNYAGKGKAGSVRFKLLPQQGTAIGASGSGWDYKMAGFKFSSPCSKRTLTVPGSIPVYGRETKSQRPKFTLPAPATSVTGRLSGALAKPTVKGAMKVLEGPCKGRTLRFTATASR